MNEFDIMLLLFLLAVILQVLIKPRKISINKANLYNSQHLNYHSTTISKNTDVQLDNICQIYPKILIFSWITMLMFEKILIEEY
ncbi:hypothetical protein BpHYR1_053457 [Brachionus plicatilis]|uniref:Uncharacterized protein n=1 Tax=Brachionus plicatilis TaxID=10195 RepID=A0A3M7QQP2_BRAPC|nr:hypothetical protein BpHYR1_053457 [Brachionus plicatilis]